MFNFINFFKSVFGLSKDAEIREYDFSFKHVLIRVFLLLCIICLSVVHHVFFLLDEVFLFVYRFTPIKKPLMIIGVPRTGTTLLYRTLAEDRDNFTCFTLGEIILAPSLIQKYLFYGLYRFDKLLGAPIKRSLLLLGTKALRFYDAIHKYNLLKPEEDELILLHIYSTVVLKFVFPGSRVFDKYIAFDEKLSPWEKRNILNFQKRCIKKHLFFWKTIQGKEKTFLSKNPIYSPKINSLFEFYPDLNLVLTTRNLDEVIPSFVSMNAAILKSFHSTKHTYPNAAMARKVIVAWQEQLTHKLKGHDVKNTVECKYELLMTNLKEQVIAIYSTYGISMSEAYLEVLNKKQLDQRLYKSDHTIDRKEMEKAWGKF